jgi:hypothetical protein
MSSSFYSLLLLGNTSSGIPTCFFPFGHGLFCLCSNFIRRCVFTERIYELTKWVHQVEEDTDYQLTNGAKKGKGKRHTYDPLGNLLLVWHRVELKSRLCKIYKLSLLIRNRLSDRPSLDGNLEHQ